MRKFEAKRFWAEVKMAAAPVLDLAKAAGWDDDDLASLEAELHDTLWGYCDSHVLIAHTLEAARLATEATEDGMANAAVIAALYEALRMCHGSQEV